MYEDWNKEQLIEELNNFKKKKRYGLVWEYNKEESVEKIKKEFPYLLEDLNKKIISDPNKPTNLIIEGDNYHALSMLNYTHKEKIDVIYIDPPYNTGAKDWKYNNDYVDSEDSFRHSKWINMMYKRLKIAKNLLNETGFLILAIDHYELFQIGMLLDEIFGEKNRLGLITVVHKAEGRQFSKSINPTNEFYLFYSKNNEYGKIKNVAIDSEISDTFDLQDEIGKYKLLDYIRLGGGSPSLRVNNPAHWYPIYVNKDSLEISVEKKEGFIEIFPITDSGQERTWNTSQETFKENFEKGDVLSIRENGGIKIKRKYREQQQIKTHWIQPKYNATRYGTQLLNQIIPRGSFDFPKSLYAVIDALKITTPRNGIILDFFAGSGTTGHAVIDMNKQDDGNRSFILCTNNENSIAEEVTYERIKRVIEGYTGLENKKKYDSIKANLRYMKTNFVPFENTDSHIQNFSKYTTELIKIKENTFEEVHINEDIKIYRNEKKYLVIIFDEYLIKEAKEIIKEFDKKITIYTFSLSDDIYEEEFEDLDLDITLNPFPSPIKETYKGIING